MAKETPTTINPKLYRIREGAQVLAVSERQVYHLIRDGKLRVVKLPGIRASRLVASEVEALADTWSQTA